jgi:hypothetical protein
MIDHVRSIIIEYLAGRFDANELATRLPDPLELDEADDDTARELTLRAVGYLSELERGDRTESGLRSALVGLVAAQETATPEPQYAKNEFVEFQPQNAVSLPQRADTQSQAAPA